MTILESPRRQLPRHCAESDREGVLLISRGIFSHNVHRQRHHITVQAG
jgi:hypothetical protein